MLTIDAMLLQEEPHLTKIEKQVIGHKDEEGIA